MESPQAADSLALIEKFLTDQLRPHLWREVQTQLDDVLSPGLRTLSRWHHSGLSTTTVWTSLLWIACRKERPHCWPSAVSVPLECSRGLQGCHLLSQWLLWVTTFQWNFLPNGNLTLSFMRKIAPFWTWETQSRARWSYCPRHAVAEPGFSATEHCKN